MRKPTAAEWVALLVLVAATGIGITANGLPAVVRNSAHDATVSADRALPDLRVISATPHPMGTASHDRVRNFLVQRLRALGCADVGIQQATGFNTLDGPIAASIANVVGRRPGTGRGPAILLTAHYDAVPRSFGAGDDGAAVAAILETLRALQNGPPLARDVIIVFTDAEEAGLLGAEAFVDLHPWRDRVGAVLNFDGRGDRGPVYMFQTSPGNAPLIAALDAGVANARTNSLTGEVYRHLPSDTDLSIWLHAGLPIGALNFANVGGYTHYHTPIDNFESLDPRVVQQMADYAFGLVRQLGNSPLSGLQSHDDVYFNAPLVGVLHYPAAWARPLAIAALIVVILLIVLWRGRLRPAGVTRGTTLMFLSLAAPALLVFGGWRLVQALHPDYVEILQRDPYNSLWYLLAAVGLTVAIVAELQYRFAERTSTLERAIAPLALWAIAGIIGAFMMPGATYLFIIPVAGMLAGAACATIEPDRNEINRAMIALTAVPVLVLWPPLILALETSLTAQMLAFCALLVGMVLTALIVPLEVTGPLRRIVAIAAVGVTAFAIVIAETGSGFNAERKQPDSLFFLQDVDSTRAWWVSFDRRADDWTSRALGTAPTRRTFDPYRLTPSGGGLLSVETTPVEPPASPVHLLQHDLTDSTHRVHLHIDRTGEGEQLTLILDDGIATAMILNDRTLVSHTADRYSPQYRMGSDGTVLRFFGVPDAGVDLWITIVSSGHPSLRLITSTQQLPTIDTMPVRPPEFMSKPFIPTDVTMFSRVIQL